LTVVPCFTGDIIRIGVLWVLDVECRQLGVNCFSDAVERKLDMPLKYGALLVHLDMGGNMIAHDAKIGPLLYHRTYEVAPELIHLGSAERDCNRGDYVPIGC
jgi:hypothetical protein